MTHLVKIMPPSLLPLDISMRTLDIILLLALIFQYASLQEMFFVKPQCRTNTDTMSSLLSDIRSVLRTTLLSRGFVLHFVYLNRDLRRSPIYLSIVSSDTSLKSL